MNRSDAERLASVLELLGLKETKDETEADLLIAVACSVRLSATNRVFGTGRNWQKIKKPEAKTLLTGCVLKEDKKKLKKYFDEIFSITDMGKVLPKIVTGKKQLDVSSVFSGQYLEYLPNYSSDFKAYIPIMTGCDNFCSYCAVPYTRGREKSRPQKDIEQEVRALVRKGYLEIVLLGQNVNSYKPNFTKLIKNLDKIAGEHRIYFYSNHPKDVSPELIATLPNLKHFPNYLHLPLQSGNDAILRSMNRHYTQQDYLNLVKKIKTEILNVTLTTDIIVGYPGETEKQFQDTAQVMKKVGFDMAFIAKYSERPGTLSARCPDNVSEAEKKSREKILQEILADSSYAHNTKIVGTIQRVLIDSQKKDKYYGRTDSYKVVEINNNQKLKIGQFIKAKIIKAEKWKLIASLVS